MPDAHGSADPGAQRARLRALRRGLGARERELAGRAIVRELLRLRLARPGRRIGAYMAVRGEASVAGFIATALARGASVYLPKIALARAGTMHLLPIGGPRELAAGAYGIPSPSSPVTRRARPRELDVVLVPLLGFDSRGHRLGMGAGFYDRWLRRRRDQRAWRRPLLIGVGFAIQELPAIRRHAWDVRLDAIVTERGVVRPVHDEGAVVQAKGGSR
jgi:5-formyltetrahydrofolate cyclo-ligase